ncbi:hypothetical protein [Pontibacter ruber]|uniref:Outer membrane protein beta-barrel domain-containing protein n=1 Tax=Pontibacter ruber TaxID=1343895 RepID=A0ABW5CU13_9BACT|nr:hypothetical protein [Pontibacter ruber]
MRYIYFLLFLLLPLSLSAQYLTQPISAYNAVYGEVGGNGDVYSLNYDRIVFQQSLLKAALRVGVGTNLFFMKDEPSVYPIVPVEALGMVGRRQKHLEFGLGYTRRFTEDPELLHNMFFARIGFRYHTPDGGLVVRVAATPFVSPENEQTAPGPGLIPRFGLSIGRSF